MTSPSPLRRRSTKAALGGFILGSIGVLVASSGDPATASGAEKPPVPIVAPMRPEAAGLASLTAAVAPGHRAERPAGAWAIPARSIDPDLAEVEGDRLVQRLDDGTAVELTLDPMLQRQASRSLEKYKVEYGVVVAIDPRTGALLALAEHAEHRPELRHLALQAEGPAASVFKVITATALVELGGLAPDQTICVHGGHKNVTLYNLRPVPNLDKRCETLAEALGSSNNVAFARWADQLLRPAQLQAVADRFLFNRRLPFLWGVAPSEARIPTGSRLGFARSAAGFEGTHMSPLHAALITAGLANDGVMMAPRLVRSASRGDETLYTMEPTALTTVASPTVARTVMQMMVATTETGTAHKFFYKGGKPRIPGVAVAGKTGSLSQNDTGVARHYSWFVAAAPADAPEIVVASLVVNGEQWTVKGAVPARELLDDYFRRKDTGHADAAPTAADEPEPAGARAQDDDSE
ncbi:MAG: penicillin-binding protein [Myxococcales bacterium]|nr:penicillin-binding protein [Myxococcales bacterium]MCB9733867.1 penicillin-binding protein [Deltaproteobacteria bacterium]